jgi:DNA-binding MarR family transcriptional regulator
LEVKNMATRREPRQPGSVPLPSTARKPGAKAAPGETVTQVLRRFRLVFNTVQRHFRAVETRSGISGAQAWALSVVAAQPGIGVNELARAMHVHQSTASNLLRSLMAAGLVISERAGEDRRTVQLEATALGHRVLAKAPPPLTGVLPEALARLDRATLQRLDQDLGRLICELHADPEGDTVLIGLGDVPLGQRQGPAAPRRRRAAATD